MDKKILPPSADSLERLLVILAGLGAATLADLEALVGGAIPGEIAVALADHPEISRRAAEFILTPAFAAEMLANLERNHPQRYQSLMEQVVDYLALKLQSGETTAESNLMDAFERLANRLLESDPKNFPQWVRKICALPLRLPSSRHLCRYFDGVVLTKTKHYAPAIEAFESLIGEPNVRPQILARAFNSCGICHWHQGRLEAALAYYTRSLEITSQLGNSNRLLEGKLRLNMGILAYGLHRYEEAEERLSRALEIFTELGDLTWIANTHNELGLVYRDRGQWAEALTALGHYVSQREADGAYEAVGRGMNNIGEVLLFQGESQQAAAAFEKAKASIVEHTYRVDILLNEGMIQQSEGRFGEAQLSFQAALDEALQIGREDILPEVYYRLGDSLRLQARYDAALQNFQSAAVAIERSRTPMTDEGLKISLLGRWQQIYEALVLHCLANSERLSGLADAFHWAERARARAFVETLMAQHAPAQPAELTTGAATEVATLSEIQATLPEQWVLLSYFTTGVLIGDAPLLQAIPKENPLRPHLLTPAHTLLFVITRRAVDVYDCAVDPNLLSMATPRGHDAERMLEPAVLRRLYELLLAKGQEIGAARQLVIIPHGPLHHAPFAALLDEVEQPVIRESGPVLTYAPSATIWRAQTQAAVPAEALSAPLLAVGYNGRPEERLLRYAEEEADVLAGLLRGDAWVGPELKKVQLPERVSGRRWLHFSCHGWFNHEQPLESYLETGRDERLTAREVMEQWRLGAELVTLSACRTGVSRILRGDEPMGLIRAFLYAGARAVLVTQWPVEELSTFLFMRRFYTTLQNQPEGTLTQALHDAQIWLRELTAAEVRELQEPADGGWLTNSSIQMPTLPDEVRPFAHPRYWAAFILVGGS
jgi:CHAT domain-containing protein/tetratricopeptide (TPR) repeat protein